MRAALALPVLALPVRSGAVEVSEVGFSVLGYRERGLMKITEPVLWGRVRIAETWELSASAIVDIITGASPQLVSNAGGKPVQVITGASVIDRRRGGDVKLTKRFEDFSLSASRTVSDEEDYSSRAFGLEASWDLDGRLTTITAGYGRSNDRVGSADNPALDEPRDTHEYLIGLTRVLSPLAVVQTTLLRSEGEGWYNDPYKFTLTIPEGGGPPRLSPDLRPSERNSWSWLTRYRQHVPGAMGTIQTDYRYYRDDWGIRSHTLEVAFQRDLGTLEIAPGGWALRPALRYYTQSAASFYTPVIPQRRPAYLSSDQRLGAFGGLSPSLRVILRQDSGLTLEGTVGYYHNAADLRLGGSGSAAFETLRAWYVLGTIVHTF